MAQRMPLDGFFTGTHLRYALIIYLHRQIIGLSISLLIDYFLLVYIKRVQVMQEAAYMLRNRFLM